MTRVLVLDRDLGRDFVRKRKNQGQDRYDEVWDGVYVMPSMPSLEHQELVHDLEMVFDVVVVQKKNGKVYPGANVSDQAKDWKKNYRIPDIVVLLKNSRARKRGSHIYGGPEFLVEIQSPEEDPQEKMPFYAKIRVKELLIVHRDSRELKLFRNNGQDLVPVVSEMREGELWLVSQVLPLAFRRITRKSKGKIEVQRTDGIPGQWVI
jgi:Uma2 family endonuclease